MSGKLQIITSPKGADVWINGLKAPSTPTNLILDPGTYHVRIVKKGYSSYETTIELKNNRVKGIGVNMKPISSSGSCKTSKPINSTKTGGTKGTDKSIKSSLAEAISKYLLGGKVFDFEVYNKSVNYEQEAWRTSGIFGLRTAISLPFLLGFYNMANTQDQKKQILYVIMDITKDVHGGQAVENAIYNYLKNPTRNNEVDMLKAIQTFQNQT